MSIIHINKFAINRFVNSQFKNIIKYSCIINKETNDLAFHNLYRLKHKEKGPETYTGKFQCGVSCFILGNILKKYIPIKMYLYEFGYGKYKEDHVFLKSNDLIIDPTYKQFFVDNRKEGISAYNNYLYEKLPPFFVGTYEDLQNILTILKNKNSDEFMYNILENHYILDNWKETKDITNRLFSCGTQSTTPPSSNS
jgi:hypothetical protein